MCDEQIDSLLSSLLSGAKDSSSLSKALQDCSVGGWSSEAVLGCAARCLSWFVQLNWTGPPSAGLLVESFMGEAKWQKLNSDVLEEFVIDGISPYQLCAGVLFLHMASVLVQSICDKDHKDQSICDKDHKDHSICDKDHKDHSICDKDHKDQSICDKDHKDQSICDKDHKDHSICDKDLKDQSLCKDPKHSLEVPVLTMRCLFKHQQLLEDRSSSLWQRLTAIMDTINTHLATSTIKETEKSELYLEMGHISLYYIQYDSAKGYFDKARELNGIQAALTGVLGRRTRFQEKDTAQLVLQVTTSSSPSDPAFPTDHTSPIDHTSLSSPENSDISQFPREVHLDDDTVLDKMKLITDTSAGPRSCPLNSLQQATLLALCCHNRKTKPVDSLSDEETDAYLSYILEQPQCWAVHSCALFFRSLLGRHRSRLKQRSMQQLEELVQACGRPEPSMKERNYLCYSVPQPSLWSVQKELAESLMSLGCYGSAVEILQRLQLWEELALCYVATDRRAKAREVIQQQLDKQTTPSLLCLMGDITQDTRYYEKAWEVSGCRSARAQKSLGLRYMKEKKWTKCADSLQLSLKVNPLQEGLWFTLACAASHIQDVDLSIKAGHQAVTLDPNCAEAWNNLAGAYLKRNNKAKAQRLFKEALRCSYDNSKIWENYLVVSVELGSWVECMEACHRLLDLGAGQVVDSEILAILMKAGCEDVSKESVPPAVNHRDSLGKLLARAVSQKSVPADVWQVCAQFHLKSTNSTDHVKGVAELQKAQRMCRQVSGWDKDLKGLTRVTQITLDYCKACRQVYGQPDKSAATSSDKEVKAALASAKLALQGVIAKVKSFGLVSGPEVEKMLQDLEEEKELLLQLS